MAKEISKLLWLPKEKGSVSKSVKTLMSDSWFSASMFVQASNSQMNSSLSPSPTDIVQQKIAEKQNSLSLLSLPKKNRRKGNNENEKSLAVKAMKIRLYPTRVLHS
jgi:hypothetical protein